MLIGLIAAFGIPLGFTIYILVTIFNNANKIEQYKSLFFKPFYRLWKWGAKSYIASTVNYQVNEFFSRHISKNIANNEEYDIKIHWVESKEDPVLKEDNSIILCLKKDKDQARNILKAAEEAIPIITHKYIRTNLKKHINDSIDLTTLRTLANRLGNHGKFAFKKYHLDDKIKSDENIKELFQKLVQVDNRGFFVPIFLNELEYVSDGIYANGDSDDLSNEIIEFIEYLIKTSEIEVGQDVEQWSYFSTHFNAGILLLANNERMVKHGVKPYLDRITKKLKQGHQSIYILSEENSWEFLEKYEEVLKESDRVLVKGKYQVEGIINNDEKRKSRVKIVLLRKVDVFVDDLFKEKISASEIEVGKRFQGQLIDVSSDIALVSIMGLDGFIKRDECSWYKTNSCLEILTEGDRADFEVKAIDENRMCLELTMKFPEEEPWTKFPIPKVGERTSITIFSKNHFTFYSKDSIGQIIEIPISEVSWQSLSEAELNDYLNEQIDVRILSVDTEKKQILGSIRQLENNPWPEINKKIRPDSEFIGKVTEVHEHFLRVNILDGVIGIIPKERLQEAGGVYTNYKSNIVVGQGIEVVVSRVFIEKEKIHLKLKT